MEVNNNLKLKRNPTMNLDKNYSYYLYDPELKKRHLKSIPNDIMYRYYTNQNDIILKIIIDLFSMVWIKHHMKKKN